MEKLKGVRIGNNEHGFTLVELLSSLALLSTVLLLAGSIHFFSQKQMNDQSVEIHSQSNARLAANLLTKDIRRAVDVTVAVNKTDFSIKNADNSTDNYTYSNSTLLKNGQSIVTNLQKFEITKNPVDNSISVTIADLPKTTIYIRK